MLCTHPTACAPTSARPAPARHHAGPACRGATTPAAAWVAQGGALPLSVCRLSCLGKIGLRPSCNPFLHLLRGSLVANCATFDRGQQVRAEARDTRQAICKCDSAKGLCCVYFCVCHVVAPCVDASSVAQQSNNASNIGNLICNSRKVANHRPGRHHQLK